MGIYSSTWTFHLPIVGLSRLSFTTSSLAMLPPSPMTMVTDNVYYPMLKKTCHVGLSHHRCARILFIEAIEVGQDSTPNSSESCAFRQPPSSRLAFLTPSKFLVEAVYINIPPAVSRRQTHRTLWSQGQTTFTPQLSLTEGILSVDLDEWSLRKTNTPVLNPVFGGGFTLLRVAQLGDARRREALLPRHLVIWTYCQAPGIIL